MGGCHVERLEDNPRDSLGEGASLLETGELVDDRRVDDGEELEDGAGRVGESAGLVFRVRVALAAVV